MKKHQEFKFLQNVKNVRTRHLRNKRIYFGIVRKIISILHGISTFGILYGLFIPMQVRDSFGIISISILLLILSLEIRYFGKKLYKFKSYRF